MHLNDLESSLSKNPNEFWGYAKQHLRKKKLNICLRDGAGYESLPAEAANRFAEYFSSCYLPQQSSDTNTLGVERDEFLSYFTVDIEDIIEAINRSNETENFYGY